MALLLNDELVKKVEAKIAECFKKASEKYNCSFPEPTIKFDLKSTTAGTATAGKWLLRFNLILLHENEKHFIDHVVPHEVAHLVARKCLQKPDAKRMRSHGKEWAEVMELFGIPADRCHFYDTTSIQPRKYGKRNTVAHSSRKVTGLASQIQKLKPHELEMFKALVLQEGII